MGAVQKVTYDAKTLAYISKRIKDGVTEGSIAIELGITPQAFSTHKKNNPLLAEAVANSRMNLESEVVGYLFNMIRDPLHKSHAASVFFYLKTQCRWRETDKTPDVIVAPDGMKFRLIQTTDVEKADE